jgi:transposase
VTEDDWKALLLPSKDDAPTKEKRRAEATKHARRRKKEARKKNRSKCFVLTLLMLGRFHLSRRDVIAFLSEVFGIDVSLGLLSKIEQQATGSLDGPYQEAIVATQQAPVICADETSWSHGGVPGWLWCATTGVVARYRIDDRRGEAAAIDLLGPREEDVTVSDRWVAYEMCGRRQVCWAHLERNARALTERCDGAKLVGNRVLVFIRKIFRLWHRLLDAETTRRGLRCHVRALGNKLLHALSRMRNVAPVAQTFITGLLKVEDHLFTFTEVETVEPTNNLAERELCPAVLWRRITQATRSERGRRFVERILTIVCSLRAQGRNVFAFPRDLLNPDTPMLSLLPAPDYV